MRRLGLLLLIAFACSAAPAAADTSISSQGRTLVVISEDPGIKNNMTISESGGNIVISDEADPFGMRSSPPCIAERFNSQNNATRVSCPRSSFNSMSVALGGAEDKLTVTVAPGASGFLVSLAGESAADVIKSGDTEDVLSGESGNDKLDSGGGNDEIEGGDGDDMINGGAGNDKIQGDGGSDTIDAGAGDDNVKTRRRKRRQGHLRRRQRHRRGRHDRRGVGRL